MPADFTIKAGDTEPVFAEQILDDDGPVNLTGATVQLVVRSLTATKPLGLTGIVSVFDATNGKVEWQPSAQDTAIPGTYMGNWAVTWANGKQQSYPTSGYLWITIEENLTTVGGQQLVSLPDVKDYLNITGSDRSHDAKLVRFIRDATPVIENVVGPIALRTFDEWHDGGQFFIQLRRRPSTALGTSPVLNIEGCDEYRGPTKYALAVVPDPAAATTYSVMLDPQTATLYRRTTGGGTIAFGAGGPMPSAVHVIYQAGQQTVPGNVYEATLEAIRVNYQTTMPTGFGSRSIADEDDRSGPPLGFFLPRRCLELLSPMRRHPAIA